MKIADARVVDVETTISNKGDPFDVTNKLVCVGVKNVNTGNTRVLWDPNKLSLPEGCWIIAFNVKFDLAWLRRADLLPKKFRVWDLQLWEFMEAHQRLPYPSLNTACERLGLGSKVDVVKEEYWSKGYDTTEIPKDILERYTIQDVELEAALFEYQIAQKRPWTALFLAQCRDLIILHEMEVNGLRIDLEGCRRRVIECREKIKLIEAELSKGYEGIPINFNSDVHLSAYLYGGSIAVDDRIPIGVYKTGKKTGQTRYKVVQYNYELPRLVKPLEKSALLRENCWSTNDDTLRSLRPNKKVKRILDLLKERSKLEKLTSTYYEGFPKLMKKMNWPEGEIHGRFNQTVAVTGRLSSAAPNEQNIPPEMKELLISRYD